MPKPDDLVAVAHIAKPFGVRGEISVLPLVPAAVAAEAVILRRLYLRPELGPRRGIVSEAEGVAVRMHQDRWLIRLRGVETPEAVAELRGADLCLPPAELPPLPEGMWWEHQLQACRVIDAQRGDIGAARELNLSSAQARMVVEKSGGGVFEFPWTPPLLAGVDLAAAQIRVDLPADWPGLDD